MQVPRRNSVWLCVSACLLSAAWVGIAQTTAGSISGRVVDAQEAAIPHAKVSVKNTATNATYEASTDLQGHFVFPVVLPGTYVLDIESQGFKKFEQQNVVVNANSALSVGTLQLQVGQVVQTVEVTAAGEQLQTDTAQRSDTIVGTQLHNIEVNGRSPLLTIPRRPIFLTTPPANW
jgi:hypothetical protein